MIQLPTGRRKMGIVQLLLKGTSVAKIEMFSDLELPRSRFLGGLAAVW